VFDHLLKFDLLTVFFCYDSLCSLVPTSTLAVCFYYKASSPIPMPKLSCAHTLLLFFHSLSLLTSICCSLSRWFYLFLCPLSRWLSPAQAAAILNLFLVYGPALLQGNEGYPVVCYEIARVSANKVFKKLLELSSADGNESPIQEELRQLMSAGDHVNAVVEGWLANREAFSPTREEVLQVVASAQTSLSLPNRQDLLNFENFVEDDASSSLARGRLTELVFLFCTHIHVFPPRPVPTPAQPQK